MLLQGVHYRVYFMIIVWQALKSHNSLFWADYCFLNRRTRTLQLLSCIELLSQLKTGDDNYKIFLLVKYAKDEVNFSIPIYNTLYIDILIWLPHYQVLDK